MNNYTTCKSRWLKPGNLIEWYCRKTTIAKAVRIGERGSDAEMKAHGCKFWEILK